MLNLQNTAVGVMEPGVGAGFRGKTGLVGTRGSAKAFKAGKTVSQTSADPSLPTQSTRFGLENRLHTNTFQRLVRKQLKVDSVTGVSVPVSDSETDMSLLP